MKTKRRHEGYLFIDPGEGPTISLEEAAKVGGLMGAGIRGIFEAGVITCCHCQRQVLVNPLRTRDRNHCRKCDHYVCDDPACIANCNGGFKALLDKELEELHKREAAARAQAAPHMREFQAAAFYQAAIAVLHDHDARKSKQFIKKALELAPDKREYLWHLGCCEMLLGEWSEGWVHKDRAHGMRKDHVFAHMDPKERWKGERGKRVLVLAEQGMGDMVMMSRYLPWVVERSSEVRLICHDALEPLMRKIEGVNVTDSETEFEYDVWIYADSLPVVHATKPDTIPQTLWHPFSLDLPMFLLDPRLNVRKVGICTRGSATTPHDRYRSMDEKAAAKLVDFKGKIEFYSIFCPGPNELTERLHNAEDTAAALLQMDEVVSVDTATAHLAGSLGIKTHLLLSRYPEWRWPFNRTTTPWYPSVTIHWQKEIDNWSDPIDTVHASWEHWRM